MSYRQEEYPHNTREQVEGYLQTAADITAELDIAPDLTGIAFAKAVDLLAAKQLVLEQVGGVMLTPGPNQH